MLGRVARMDAYICRQKRRIWGKNHFIVLWWPQGSLPTMHELMWQKEAVVVDAIAIDDLSK